MNFSSLLCQFGLQFTINLLVVGALAAFCLLRDKWEES